MPSREGWDPAAGGFVEGSDIEGRRIAPRRGCRVKRADLLFRQRRPNGDGIQKAANSNEGLDYLLAASQKPRWQPGFVHLASIRRFYHERDCAIAMTSIRAARVSAVVQLRGCQVRNEDRIVLELSGPRPAIAKWRLRRGIPATMPRRQHPQMHLFERDRTFEPRAIPYSESRRRSVQVSSSRICTIRASGSRRIF